MSKELNVEELVDHAFSIGMAQDRNEILEFTKFLYDLRPHNVMEIGSKLGGNFYILSTIATGMKISLDLQGGIHGGWILNAHSYLGDVFKLRNDFFKKEFDNISMVSGNSHDVVSLSHIVDLLKNEKLDLLYLDGDHTREGIKQDYHMYKSLVRKGGYIVFHDINDSKHHRDTGCYVSTLWNELQGNKIEFNQHLHWAGIGVLQV